MGKKLYVGNLSYSITEDDLKEAFAQAGEIESVKIITDAGTGRSKGFGFVEMVSEEEAAQAITSLNGTSLGDRALNVSEARPQRERGARGRSGFGGGGRGHQGFDKKGRKPNNWR